MPPWKLNPEHVLLTILNHASSPLVILDGAVTLKPSEPHETNIDSFQARSISIRAAASKESTLPDISSSFVRLRLKLGRKWTRHSIEHNAWDIYEFYIAKSRYAVLIFDKRNSANFLSSIPDTVPLSGLLLPGTHQTMAFKGWPLAQCQSRSTPLLTQLRSGIRVLDIRISLYDGVLKTAHDILPMGTPFATILTELRHFLTHEGLREAVVVSIKQEDWKATDGHVFSAAVRREIETHDPAGLVGWFLSHRVPALGEVRGKAVLFSRFGADGAEWERGLAGLGIHPSTWPDSRPEGFTWTCAGTLVRVHDWYRVPTFLSIPEKLRRATRVLCPDAFDPRIVSVDEACELPPVTAPTRKGYSPLYMFAPPVPVSGKSNQPPLAITFLSASAIPFALPPTIARGFGWPSIGMGVEGVNARFTRWCLRKLAGVDEDHRRYDPRIRGWVLVDYFAEPSDMVGLLIELNWRGRVAGEEGWV